MGRDAFASETDRHRVGVGIGATHLAFRRRVVDVDVLDYFSFFVVESPQEGACTEEAAQAAIGESGKRVS